jgi:hypothetical protein
MLYQDAEHIIVLVDSAPQVMALAIDRQKDLVEMPCRIVKILELAFLLEVIPLASPYTSACLPPRIHGYSPGIEIEKAPGERAWTGNTC